MCLTPGATIYGAHQLYLCCTYTLVTPVALLSPHYPQFCYPLFSSSLPLQAYVSHSAYFHIVLLPTNVR